MPFLVHCWLCCGINQSFKLQWPSHKITWHLQVGSVSIGSCNWILLSRQLPSSCDGTTTTTIIVPTMVPVVSHGRHRIFLECDASRLTGCAAAAANSDPKDAKNLPPLSPNVDVGVSKFLFYHPNLVETSMILLFLNSFKFSGRFLIIS